MSVVEGLDVPPRVARQYCRRIGGPSPNTNTSTLCCPLPDVEMKFVNSICSTHSEILAHFVVSVENHYN